MTSHPLVHHALLRCSRQDSKAAPLFQPVKHLQDVWIMDIGTKKPLPWPAWLEHATTLLKKHKRKLSSLAKSSTDCALHIVVDLTEPYHAAAFTPAFCTLAAGCGFSVEVVNSNL
jgi:hypothetical protein